MYYDDSKNVRVYSLPEEKVTVPSYGITRATYLLENNRLLTTTDSHLCVYAVLDTEDAWQ